MPAEHIAGLTARAMQGSALRRWNVLADYWALTKPDVNLLILITTFASFCLARPIHSESFPIVLLLHTLLGTLLVASGMGTLNQFVERRFDTQMRRTKTAASCSRQNRAFACSLVWDITFSFRSHLSGRSREFACKSARGAHIAHLLIFVHSAQTKNAAMHIHWGHSWRRASSDWMGGGIWKTEPGGMGALWPGLPMAISPFHGHCVDVPRRLRAGWVSCSSSRGATKQFYGVAEHTAISQSDSVEPCPNAAGKRRFDLYSMRQPVQRGLPVLRGTTRVSQDQYSGTPSASCVDPVSSAGICFDGAGSSVNVIRNRTLRKRTYVKSLAHYRCFSWSRPRVCRNGAQGRRSRGSGRPQSRAACRP